MAYYDNTSDAGIHFTSSVPEGLEAYQFPSQVPTTENASNDDIHCISSMTGELETYPFLGQMSATENVGNAGIYPTSSVPGELETYPFLSQLPATEEVDFLAGYTLANPWGMAEQPNHLASSATTSYGTYHCHHSSLQSVSDMWTPRASGVHLVRRTHRRLR